MKKFLAMASILALTLGLAGCGVNPDRAKSALEAQGLTNVQIGGDGRKRPAGFWRRLQRLVQGNDRPL
jgi:hypothetical protein